MLPPVDSDELAGLPDTMTVTDRVVDGVVVLTVVGRMTVETRESALTQLVKSRLADSFRAFVRQPQPGAVLRHSGVGGTGPVVHDG